MKTSTTKNKITKNPGILKKFIISCIWLALWQLAAYILSQEILLVSPVKVFFRLLALSVQGSFWLSIVTSLCNIMAGFLLAVLTGIVLAALTAASPLLCEFLAPLLLVMKSTPVVSFILLAYLFIPSRNLSIFISFLMVTPIVYFNTYQGIQKADEELLEMSRIFHVGLMKKIKGIYIPSALPYLQSACAIGFGFAWKSGIAAEVIGLPTNTIGIQLYNAKIILETPDLYAWTVVVIALSVLLEKMILRIVK